MKTRQVLRLLLVALAAGGGCTDSLSGGAPSSKPIAPSSLAGLLQNGGTQIALSWVDASTDEAGFRLEVNTSAFGTPPYADVFFLPANSTSYVYPTRPNATYFFRVYGITGPSQSDPSNVVTLLTPDFPSPPYYFTALATGPNVIEVKWLNGAGVNGNTVQRSPDGSSWSTIFNNATGPGVVGLSDSSLLPNTVYYYRGYASSTLGTSGPTPVVSMRTQTTPGGVTTVTTGAPLFTFEDIGIHSSLAFNGGANQVIASYDLTMANLVVTTGGFPGPYFTQTIGTGQGNGYDGVSVATNNLSHVHVASHYYAGDELRFVTNETGPYTSTTIDQDLSGIASVIVGLAPVIRVAPDQSIHIVYKAENSSTGDGWLRHAYRSSTVGSAWTIENFVGYEPVLRGHSFAIDAAGTLHVIYVNQVAGVYQVMHAWKTGGFWNYETVAPQGMPSMNSVAVGAGNTLHVAYKDDASGALWYATNVSGTWTYEQVHFHNSGNLGRHNSILYFPTASGDVHVSYYDSVNGNLWYAGKSAVGGIWNRRLVDSAGDVGRYTSINSDGAAIYVSYYDAGNGKLKVLQNPQN